MENGYIDELNAESDDVINLDELPDDVKEDVRMNPKKWRAYYGCRTYVDPLESKWTEHGITSRVKHIWKSWDHCKWVPRNSISTYGSGWSNDRPDSVNVTATGCLKNVELSFSVSFPKVSISGSGIEKCISATGPILNNQSYANVYTSTKEEKYFFALPWQRERSYSLTTMQYAHTTRQSLADTIRE